MAYSCRSLEEAWGFFFLRCPTCDTGQGWSAERPALSHLDNTKHFRTLECTPRMSRLEAGILKTALAGPLCCVGTIFFSLTSYFLPGAGKEISLLIPLLSNDSHPRACFWATQPETQNQRPPTAPPREKWPLRQKVEKESLLTELTKIA